MLENEAAGGNGKINVVESIPREKRKQVSECSHFIVLPSDFEIPLMHRAHLRTLPNLHHKIGLLHTTFNGINAFKIQSTKIFCSKNVFENFLFYCSKNLCKCFEK